MLSNVFCCVFLHAEPLQAYYFRAHYKGLTFKILPRDLQQSSWPTAKYSKIPKLIASFSNLGLNANLGLFTDADIVPYYLSYYHLGSDNLLIPLMC